MSDKGFKIVITIFACIGLAAFGCMVAADQASLHWVTVLAGALGGLFLVSFVGIMLALMWSA